MLTVQWGLSKKKRIYYIWSRIYYIWTVLGILSISQCCGDKSVSMLSWTYDGFKWFPSPKIVVFFEAVKVRGRKQLWIYISFRPNIIYKNCCKLVWISQQQLPQLPRQKLHLFVIAKGRYWPCGLAVSDDSPVVMHYFRSDTFLRCRLVTSLPRPWVQKNSTYWAFIW